MYLKLMGIKRQNIALQKENDEMRAQLGSMTELKLENERLNHLLDFKQKTSMKLLGAKVIARDLSPDHYSIRINRGTRDGLRKLQGVITVNGVVGYILRANYDSAQVLVLTDRSAAIDAVVQRTRARGLVSGKSLTSCRLRYLERADDVAPNDMIVTSGLQGYFPKGFPIGKLTTVHKTPFGISQEADVEPVVNPNNLEEIFVVLNSGQEDFSDKFGDSGDFGPPLLSKQNPLPTPADESAHPMQAQAPGLEGKATASASASVSPGGKPNAKAEVKAETKTGAETHDKATVKTPDQASHAPSVGSEKSTAPTDGAKPPSPAAGSSPTSNSAPNTAPNTAKANSDKSEVAR